MEAPSIKVYKVEGAAKANNPTPAFCHGGWQRRDGLTLSFSPSLCTCLHAISFIRLVGFPDHPWLPSKWLNTKLSGPNALSGPIQSQASLRLGWIPTWDAGEQLLIKVDSIELDGPMVWFAIRQLPVFLPRKLLGRAQHLSPVSPKASYLALCLSFPEKSVTAALSARTLSGRLNCLLNPRHDVAPDQKSN